LEEPSDFLRKHSWSAGEEEEASGKQVDCASGASSKASMAGGIPGLKSFEFENSE